MAFNAIGTNHTVTFICDALTAGLFGAGGTAAAPTVPAGCYDVQATLTDITTGSPATITAATCGNAAAGVTGGAVDCSGVASPICPVGSVAAPAPGPTTPCTPVAAGTVGYDLTNTATVTINPGAPHAYRVTFTGYIPTTSQGSCPAGTTQIPGVVLSTSYGNPPGSFQTGATGACQFSVSADKKYVEITNITLTIVPPGATCGGQLFFAEGLKAFFGPSCTVIASVTGTVILKTGVDCATEPATGTPAPAPFPVGSTYACVNGSLSVVGIPLSGVPLTFTPTGPASFNVLNTLGSLCAGSLTTGSGAGISGTAITLCPTGPGAVSISACLALPLPNNQPQVCSNTIQFTFTEVARRVVPYVRWAGEKIALTKCFGPGLAGAPIEFVLKGNNPGLNATLIPTGLATTLGATGAFPTADTIWTTTDPNGCASVLGFADGEGVMSVDAAIFSTTAAGIAAGSPIVNEHVFEVFYLKFDHVDLENINPASVYASATALKPFLSFLAGTPAVLGATTFPESFTLPSAPGANGEVAGPTGFAVPLCQIQFLRAMVHGYFEIPGDPSGRPATSVAIPGAPLTGGGSPSAGSYVLPAGRWVLPEDWPVLATFAGFGTQGQPGDFTPSSVLAWDLNSGWVFNPAGENPVFCTGDGVFAAVSPEANAGFGSAATGTAAAAAAGTGVIAPADTDLGPCYSQDGTGTFYSTAPNGPNCVGGETVGIGPFDPTQACTNPFPLTYTPSGATLIGGLTFPGAFPCPAGVAGPCLVPTGLNSTYLPNGTLNQWDAPMPPAQVSFGITSGPAVSFLDEVNKTALYALTFDEGAPSAAGACNRGYAVNPATGTCQLKVDPNPFYAEAIPASPFIPPIANDAGYLWNSWNFTSGTTAVVRSAPSCFSNAPAGGCVPGQSTSVSVAAASFPGGTCPTGFFATSVPPNCTVPGGINVTACVSNGTSDSVVVGDGSGFMAGMTVEVYDLTGTTIAGSFAPIPMALTITQVLPSPQPGFPNAVELVFAPGALVAAGACPAAPFSDVYIAEQFGLPVASVAGYMVGDVLTVGNCGVTAGPSCAELPIVAIDTANNILYVSNTLSVAGFFGPCPGSGSGISRPGGPGGFCEPNALVPPGTLIQSGPVAAGGLLPTQLGAPPNPYPFWQWVPAPPSTTSLPTAATVYSDNHGEAVVSLSTGVATSIPPVNGACPAPFQALALNGVVVSCQLPLQVLGPLGFANVAATLAAFSAAKPGCIQTFPSGTFVALPNATVGATGPAAGQICINALGGIEFGASATLGSTTVQAVADYPYVRGEHPPISSGPLTKVFTSAFAKSLTVSAGTPGPAGTTSFVVTITAKDVCGIPLIGEPVQVYALGNAGATVLAPVSAGVVLSANTTSAVLTVDPVTGQAVLSLEVLNTAIGTQGLVIKAVFPFEKVERFVTVIPGTTPGATVNVPYAPGWQQVGGPTGSNFSVAEALFAYDPATGTYTNATASAGALSSAPPACTGYWAYFAAPMVVSLPATSHSGDTATCNLAPGWNLIGNPFATPASIQSGVTAYHWNGTSYDVVGTIPVGGSVWIFNSGTTASTVTLTAT